jgi:hypothetical protein
MTGQANVGIKVQDNKLTDAWTFSDFEIHHNYIHDTRYHGMYLGHNWPATSTECGGGHCPYVANFSIHDNLLEDLGASGFTYKGAKTGSRDYIYNNIVRRTGIVSTDYKRARNGIGISWFYGDAYADVYNNRVEETIGPGFKISEANHLVHDNIIVGCGTGGFNPPSSLPHADWDYERWAHGIYIQKYNSPTTGTVQVYDNEIVKSGGYGISDHGGKKPNAILQKNTIKQSRVGPVENEGGNLFEFSADTGKWHIKKSKPSASTKKYSIK